MAWEKRRMGGWGIRIVVGYRNRNWEKEGEGGQTA